MFLLKIVLFFMHWFDLLPFSSENLINPSETESGTCAPFVSLLCYKSCKIYIRVIKRQGTHQVVGQTEV